MNVNNPASSSIKKELQRLLGFELYEKYSDIIPLLALCQYRLRTYKSYGSFNMIFSTEETTPALYVYRMFIYPLVYIKNIFSRSSAGKRVMFSSTVLKNDRYKSLLQNAKNITVVKTNVWSDISFYSSSVKFKEYFKQLFGQEKRYFNGHSVTGRKLKKAVSEWLEFILYASENNSGIISEKEKASFLLDKLQNEFFTRLEKSKKIIAASDISLYITINQYNIRDLLLITACRELGIKTKQLEHHASRFMHNIAEYDDIYRFCFVDDICCWNSSEVDFHTHIYKYECYTGKDTPYIYAVGNPEISYTDALNAIEKYPVQNRVTFMVSGILNADNAQALKKQLDLRNTIFINLKKMSDISGTKVLVRYPPGIDTDFRKKEEAVLSEMGFEISPSDRNSLLSDICGSCAIFGTISSVLGLAALMGRQVYQIVPAAEKYYITDRNICCILPRQIPQCDIKNYDLKLNSDNFMDYCKLLSI